jgi:hypothetical protein
VKRDLTKRGERKKGNGGNKGRREECERDTAVNKKKKDELL